MNEPWLYGLIASLILLAIGATLKAANDAFTLKKANEEIARLNSKIESLNESHNESISSIKESLSAENTELTNRIKYLEKQINLQSAKPIPTAHHWNDK